MIEDAAISCEFVKSFQKCESAAHQLGLSDVSAEDDGQSGTSADPPFCYFEDGSLKFNNLGTNTGPCTTNDLCLCIENNFCAKIPCKEGQGDCDDDTECEGSFVCGHMNCINSTMSDCCTSVCHEDSDCLDQQCNASIHQCRLDSYSTEWSKCTQESPCAKGEGDCDHLTDCKGTLLCGEDNCASGPTGMDCCTDDGKQDFW